MKKFTQLEAIRELITHDHSFLRPEFARAVTKPFGLDPRLSHEKDARSQFKGLTLYGINPQTGKEFIEGDLCEGIDAHLLAEQIADHLKVEYTQMFGRGSALRECCHAVEKYLLSLIK